MPVFVLGPKIAKSAPVCLFAFYWLCFMIEPGRLLSRKWASVECMCKRDSERVSDARGWCGTAFIPSPRLLDWSRLSGAYGSKMAASLPVDPNNSGKAVWLLLQESDAVRLRIGEYRCLLTCTSRALGLHRRCFITRLALTYRATFSPDSSPQKVYHTRPPKENLCRTKICR